MMKCSVTISPGVTGEVVVSQPVEPPGIPFGAPGMLHIPLTHDPSPKQSAVVVHGNPPPVGGSSKPVPLMSVTGRMQCCVCGFEVSLVHTVKKPLLIVTGFFALSNAMFSGAPGNSPFDSCMTRNSSLNWVHTYTGYSAEKNWKSNENEFTFDGARSLSTSSV